MLRQTVSSACSSISWQVSGGPTGTATTIFAAPRCRSAFTAARIVAPVANPSSIKITVRPEISGAGLPSRYFSSRRWSSIISRCVIDSIISSAFGSARATSSFKTRTPPDAIAPTASSSNPGTPSLRTMKTSSGTRSACATSYATGTPPRGNPSTITSSRPAYCVSFSASNRPAADRSGKAASMRPPPRSLRRFRQCRKQILHVARETMLHLLHLAVAHVTCDYAQHILGHVDRIKHTLGDNSLLNRVEKFPKRQLDRHPRWLPAFVIQTADQHRQLGAEMDRDIHWQTVANSMQNRSQRLPSFSLFHVFGLSNPRDPFVRFLSSRFDCFKPLFAHIPSFRENPRPGSGSCLSSSVSLLEAAMVCLE